MFNTLATVIAEKVRINSESDETTDGRKNFKFWLLAAVPTVLATAGGGYFLIRHRWRR